MLFKGSSAGDEKAFTVARNVSGATITTGLGVALATVAASFDGTQVTVATNANASGFLGVAVQDVPANSVAKFQIFGAVASVLLSNTGSSLTINVGDPLVPAAVGFASAAPTWANGGFKYIIASAVPVATSAAGYVSGFIRGGF